MKMSSYFSDRVYFIITQILATGFICFMLYVLRVNSFAIGFIALILILSNTAGLLFEYYKKQDFYKVVKDNLETLDKKYFIAELIDRPHFTEGAFLYDTVAAAAKSMNDHIAVYKIASQEYKEYIETWVHEIKTPIAAAKLIAENHKNEITQSMDDEISKIDAFVEQALFYSKSSNLEKDYIIKEVLVANLVKEAVKKHSKTLIESKVGVELRRLDYIVYADQKWMDFILGQIITNSVKYKSANARIVFDSFEFENGVVLTIEDNGVGISPKDIGRVFDKGFTGENGRRFAKSTGIGLYLCKKLCSKMGIGIKLESQADKGTKISIIFPKAKLI